MVNAQLGRHRITADEFTRSAIRRIVHSFYRTKEHPNVDKGFARCKEEIAIRSVTVKQWNNASQHCQRLVDKFWVIDCLKKRWRS